jgi:hypothetical protein
VSRRKAQEKVNPSQKKTVDDILKKYLDYSPKEKEAREGTDTGDAAESPAESPHRSANEPTGSHHPANQPSQADPPKRGARRRSGSKAEDLIEKANQVIRLNNEFLEQQQMSDKKHKWKEVLNQKRDSPALEQGFGEFAGEIRGRTQIEQTFREIENMSVYDDGEGLAEQGLSHNDWGQT